MKSSSLWCDVTQADAARAEVTLSPCNNCGQIKVKSAPCGFDHLAAVMEFNDFLRGLP